MASETYIVIPSRNYRVQFRRRCPENPLKGGKDTSVLSHIRGYYNKVFAEKMSRFDQIPNFNEGKVEERVKVKFWLDGGFQEPKLLSNDV